MVLMARFLSQSVMWLMQKIGVATKGKLDLTMAVSLTILSHPVSLLSNILVNFNTGGISYSS